MPSRLNAELLYVFKMNAKNIDRAVLFICVAILFGFLIAYEGSNFPNWKWYSGLIGGISAVFLYFLGEYIGEKFHNQLEKKFSLSDLKTINTLLFIFVILIILSIPVLLLVNQ